MILEFISELHSDFYPMYFYITFILTVVCSYGLLYAAHNYVRNCQSITARKPSLIYSGISLEQSILGHIQDIHAWITQKMKRKEGPEDDEDNNSSLIATLPFTNRGGQQCLINLYSLLTKNIA